MRESERLGTRREIDTPDVARQPGQQGQPGQEPGREPGEQPPTSEGDLAAGGERDPNDPGTNRPTGGVNEDGTERVDRPRRSTVGGQSSALAWKPGCRRGLE